MLQANIHILERRPINMAESAERMLY